MNGLFIRDKSTRNLVQLVYECTTLKIGQESHGIQAEDTFSVCLEQLQDKNMLQLRLSSSHDQMKVYISQIDDVTYSHMRQEQGLHVSFSGFTDQLVTILESCRRGELHAGLIADNTRPVLQFYEKRPFRNLIHLYLSIAEAPLEAILVHMNQSMKKLQEQHAFQCNQIDSLRTELSIKDENNSSLQNDIKRLKAALNEQENMIFARNMDEVKDLQHSLKNLNEQKDNDERKFKGIIFGLQEKQDRLKQEHHDLTEQLTAAEKRAESYLAECKRLAQQLGTVNEQTGRLECDLDAQKTRDRKHELNVLDLKRQLKDSRDKLNSLEKQRSDLIAELEAEKIVCQTKRKALQIATEEITKANDIILKQSKEIVGLKRKGEERAAIALKQEEIIQKTEADLKKLQKNYDQKQKEWQTYSQTNQELSNHLAELKDFSNKMEEQYKQKILTLERKLATSHRLANSKPMNGPNKILTGNYRAPTFEL